MYHAVTSLPQPLSPEEFWTEDAWQAERHAVFWDSWHLVGVKSALNKAGQFVTCKLVGVPVIVRNFDGELVALRNVCAHRQATLATAACGKSETLACPYHGWEYGADGRTRKLPGATNFPHFDHRRYCLDKFTVEQCGELVFVRLAAEGPSLRDWLGSRYELFEEWFSAPGYLHATTFTKDYPANWKIPVDISLESYHIPWVHPKTFHSDPGDELSEHEFFPNGSSFKTKLLEPRFVDHLLRAVERFDMWLMGLKYEDGYQHHHVAPNLMISRTGSLSLAQFVHPDGAESSHVLGIQFRRAAVKNGWIGRITSYLWGRFCCWLTWMILHEDLGMYGIVQQGVKSAPRRGLLGRCEERIFHYHQMIRQKVDAWRKCQAAAPMSSPEPVAEPLPQPLSIHRPA